MAVAYPNLAVENLERESHQGSQAAPDHAITNYPWFALQVRTRYESIVASLLNGKGYKGFLPTRKCRRRWSDRYKEIEQPLFPGYVFCRFNPLNRLPILTTPGVVLIVGTGKNPIPIAETEISAIETLVRSGLPSTSWPFLQVGQRVRIESGALCGLEGILLQFKGRYRVVVSVTLLQRSVAVEIEGASVTPLSGNQPRLVATVTTGFLPRQQSA